MKKYIYSLLLGSVCVAHASDFKDMARHIAKPMKRRYSNVQRNQSLPQNPQGIEQQKLEESQGSPKKSRLTVKSESLEKYFSNSLGNIDVKLKLPENHDEFNLIYQEYVKNKIKQDIQMADNLVKENKFEEALKVYKEAANNPHNTDITVWNKIGLIYLNHFDESKAELDDNEKKIMDEFLENNPDVKNIYDLDIKKLKNQVGGLTYFKKGYELDDLEAQFNYGYGLYRMSAADEESDYEGFDELEDAADKGHKRASDLLIELYQGFGDHTNALIRDLNTKFMFEKNKNQLFCKPPSQIKNILPQYLTDLEALYNEHIQNNVYSFCSFYANTFGDVDFIPDLVDEKTNRFKIFYATADWTPAIIEFLAEFPKNPFLFFNVLYLAKSQTFIESINPFIINGENQTGELIKEHKFQPYLYSLGRKKIEIGKKIEDILFGEGSEDNPTFPLIEKALNEDVKLAQTILKFSPDHPKKEKLKEITTKYPDLLKNMKEFKDAVKKMIEETQFERLYPEEVARQHNEHNNKTSEDGDHESNEDGDMMDE